MSLILGTCFDIREITVGVTNTCRQTEEHVYSTLVLTPGHVDDLITFKREIIPVQPPLLVGFNRSYLTCKGCGLENLCVLN